MSGYGNVRRVVRVCRSCDGSENEHVFIPGMGARCTCKGSKIEDPGAPSWQVSYVCPCRVFVDSGRVREQ